MPPQSKTIGHIEQDVFVAIAHPVRRRLLDALAQGELTVNALSAPFDISRSAISQHLGILLQSGLIEGRQRGRERYYRLRPDNLNEVYRWVGQFEHFWTQKLDALGAYLDEQASQDRAEADEP